MARKIIKIPDKMSEYELADLTEKIMMRHAIVHLKNGKSEKRFLLDTASHWDDTNSGKDEIVYMTNHDKDPEGFDRYAGDSYTIDEVDSIELLD